jgi:hypothetical protein
MMMGFAATAGFAGAAAGFAGAAAGFSGAAALAVVSAEVSKKLVKIPMVRIINNIFFFISPPPLKNVL